MGMMFHVAHPVLGQAKIIKLCEGCGCNFLIPVPLSAKLAEKYCSECKPVMAKLGQPLEDCSRLQDPVRAVPFSVDFRDIPVTSEPFKISYRLTPVGTDLNRRQRLQLAWAEGFGRELNTLERKQREMKIRVGGRYK